MSDAVGDRIGSHRRPSTTTAALPPRGPGQRTSNAPRHDRGGRRIARVRPVGRPRRPTCARGSRCSAIELRRGDGRSARHWRAAGTFPAKHQGSCREGRGETWESRGRLRVRPRRGVPSACANAQRKDGTMGFKERERRRKAKAAQQCAQHAARRSGVSARGWWLTLAREKAVCAPVRPADSGWRRPGVSP
jgi:hypothetical protein